MPLVVTFYDILKFLHVSLAIAWVGGVLMMSILAELAFRSSLPGRAAEFAREAGLIGERFFMPVSVLVLGLGFWLEHRLHWGFHFWIVGSLVLYGVSVVLGTAVLAPQAKKLRKLIQAEGPEADVVRRQIRVIVTIARFDLVLLFTIVFLMVTKIGQ